ncbi:MAG: Lpg1974 family pore-forming outer membrane protein [Chlamydiota bacterium]
MKAVFSQISSGFFLLATLCASEKEEMYDFRPYQVGREWDFRVILQPEVLFLRPYEGLLECAIEHEKEIATMKQTQFVPSFRISLGFQTDYDGNDLLFSYMRYHNCRKEDLSSNGLVESIVWFLDDPTFVSFLQTSWQIKLDLLDIYMRKQISIGSSFRLGLRFGMRGGILDQTIKIKRTVNTLQEESSNTSDQWFLGPKWGLDGTFLLSRHFYFAYEAAYHLLYGKYVLDHREQGTFEKKRHLDVEGIKSASELAAGFGYAFLFSEEFHADFSCKVYYLAFPAENQCVRLLVPGAGAGDLSFLGVGICARFDF